MMMRTAFAAVFISVLTASGQAFGANAPQTQKNRPKVKVTFDRASFQASYGQTLDLCMKIVPKTHFTPLVQFGSDPAGAVTGQFGGSANCADSSWSQVQIAVSLSQCVSSANLLIQVHGKTVATLPGTILLPDDESAVQGGNFQATCTPGVDRLFYLTFVNNTTGGSAANFKGLHADEIQDWGIGTFGVDTCGLMLKPPLDPHLTEGHWTIGDTSSVPNLGPNQIDDENSKCPPDTQPCITKFKQSFKIGQCTTPEHLITISVESSGIGTVTREDLQ